MKRILNYTNGKEYIDIKDYKTSRDIELVVNRIPLEKLENRHKLSHFLFNFNYDPELIGLNNHDFEIFKMIFNKINGTASREELEYLDDLLGVINDSPLIHYTYMNPIPDTFIVPNIHILFSLFFSSDNQSFTDLTIQAYLLNTSKLITQRLSFLKSIGISNPINIFNKEKKMSIDGYTELNKIYHLFETIYIKDLKIDYSKSYGHKNHKNTGILILDKPYFYKTIDSFNLKTLTINDIFQHYKFVLDCNNINIDRDYGDYKIHFVTVPLKIIFSFKNDNFYIGYLMEVVEGYTVRQIREKYIEYWTKNHEIIERAIISLVDILSKTQFFIGDLNDNDNFMWNMESNTLIYIDISESSFVRKDEVWHYESVYGYI